jgi:uncharacterized protein DUF642
VTLVNNSFELSPFDTIGTVTGWTVGGGGHVADRTAEGATAGNGAAVLSVGGDFQGDTVSQTFPTAIGQPYTIDFDAGIFGVPDPGALLQLRVQIFGTVQLRDNTIAPPLNTGPSPFDPTTMVFNHYQYSFVADSSITTLQFTSVGSGNKNADQIVDNVVVGVPGATPAPSAFTNGGFESGFSGWTAVGNLLICTATSTPIPLTVTDGVKAVQFNDAQRVPNGTLSQTFTTTPGASYTASFNVGVFGWQTTLEMRIQVNVQGNNSSLGSQTISVFGQGTGTWWTSRSITFTANSSSTTITFTDVSPNTLNTDLLLDSVNVVGN